MTVAHQLFLDELRSTQYLPPEELFAYQLRALEPLVRHARDQAPYYRDRLAPVFFGETFEPAYWHMVPLTTRADARDQGEAMFAARVPEVAGGHAESMTSGTTGTPLRFRQSVLAQIASNCNNERVYEMYGVDRAAHMAHIVGDRAGRNPYPLGRESRGWNLTVHDSRLSQLDFNCTVAEQADWLTRRRPNYLMSLPSLVRAVALHLEAAGRSLRLDAFFSMSEMLTVDAREIIERVFGCQVIDNYGTHEIGYIAFQCPAGDGYHVASESVLVELLGDDHQPVEEGMPGKVVVTSLYNYAMPLIRYVTGDYAVAAEGPCRCGRTLPRIAGIVGRRRNLFTLPDGTQKWPTLLHSEFLRVVPAHLLQVVQTAFDEIEVRYVPLPAGPHPDVEALQRFVRAHMHASVNARLVAVADIPRLSSGKIDDYFSLVTPA
jgi:phenylacetate-CoA ligase